MRATVIDHSQSIAQSHYEKDVSLSISIIFLSSFVSKHRLYNVNPPIAFHQAFNQETEMFELTGTDAYQSILMYGRTIQEARTILETEVFPIMWEEYVEATESKLSPQAQKIKDDLTSRVVR